MNTIQKDIVAELEKSFEAWVITAEFRERPWDPIFDGRPIARMPEWAYGLSRSSDLSSIRSSSR